jgi:hypothetical protein
VRQRINATVVALAVAAAISMADGALESGDRGPASPFRSGSLAAG